MHKPTHTTFDHFHALRVFKRFIAWNKVLPISTIKTRYTGFMVHSGRVY